MELISPGLRLMPGLRNRLAAPQINNPPQIELQQTSQVEIGEPRQAELETTAVAKLKADKYFDAAGMEESDQEDKGQVKPFAISVKRVAAQEAENEGSSKLENLNNSGFLAIDEEAEYSGLSKYSDMNRVVSSILKNKKSDLDDGMSKKRR